MRSLQARLHTGLSATLAVVMILVWWFTSASFKHITEEMISFHLEHDGEALLASLQRDDSGMWYLKESQVGHIYQRIFSGHYFVIEVEGQQMRSRSLWDYQITKSDMVHQDGPDNQVLLVWQSTFTIGQQQVYIAVAEDISPLKQSLQQFTQYYAIGCLITLFIIMLVQRSVIRRSLVTLRRVTSELEALSEGELSNLSSEVPREIRPLVDEVNRLLQLLSQRLQRSRNAMGNLAHSLKHPLNLLMQLEKNNALDENARKELNTNTQKIHHLMERELVRARLAGAGLPGQCFDASVELPALIDVLKRVYKHKNLNISYIVNEGGEYIADRNDMLELLGNVLDNACKWAASTVICEISFDNGMTVIVNDDGAGCDDGQLSLLTHRGVRIDESVSGAGLGLAIVKDIVELYSGELIFERSDKGGLKVKVILP